MGSRNLFGSYRALRFLGDLRRRTGRGLMARVKHDAEKVQTLRMTLCVKTKTQSEIAKSA